MVTTALQDWQEITRLYEKDSVYLAEAAHLLMRNVKYDIPDLKQQISKGTHIQEVWIFFLSVYLCFMSLCVV